MGRIVGLCARPEFKATLARWGLLTLGRKIVDAQASTSCGRLVIGYKAGQGVPIECKRRFLEPMLHIHRRLGLWEAVLQLQ
eukprot:scaffold32617_cov20-Tisochrysis_lutea.AAC.4